MQDRDAAAGRRAELEVQGLPLWNCVCVEIDAKHETTEGQCCGKLEGKANEAKNWENENNSNTFQGLPLQFTQASVKLTRSREQ